MPVAITYDASQRMLITGLECHCPLTHNHPTQDVYVGTNLLPQLPDMIRRKDLGDRALMICDDITYGVAGGRARAILANAGFTIDLCRIERDGPVEPDERAIGEAILSLHPKASFIISVGSGSMTDTARVTSAVSGKPFVSIGTAPSMDGYTSVIAPVLLKGAKIHKEGQCPIILVCDLDILRTAPPEMFQSGVGDVLGKYIAKADWALGNIINDEPFCPAASGIALDAADKLLANIDAIRERTPEGTRILIEALILAGITIMIIGNTRSVASVEHNIAHYWEMMKLARHEKPPSHGASVGVATLLVWPLYERFTKQDLSILTDESYLATLKAKALTHSQREAWMRHAFGDSIAEKFMAENSEDFLTWDEQLRRINRAVKRQDDIRRELALLPSYERVMSAMLCLSAPTTAAAVGIDPGMEALSLRCGKDYRSRYTLLKLLDETGMLEDYLS